MSGTSSRGRYFPVCCICGCPGAISYRDCDLFYCDACRRRLDRVAGHVRNLSGSDT